MKEYKLGYLSPTGDFIKSDEGEHGDTARELLVKLLGEKEAWKIGYPTEYFIYNYNFALIHMPEIGFRAVHLHYRSLTEVQKEFLKKYEDENDVYFIEERVTKRMSEKGY